MIIKFMCGVDMQAKLDSIEMHAYAKINLSLDVIGKRHDGYHDLRMIMQSVELHDAVTVKIIDDAKKGIKIECDKVHVPIDDTNTAFKAARLMIDAFGINKGISVCIQKNIPVAAGMAGGSSDAAAVIKAIDRMFQLGLSLEEMARIGKDIGADVPYCIYAGTMLAEGIGDILTPLPSFCDVPVVILKPKISVSTSWVYSNYDSSKVHERPDTEALINAIKKADVLSVASGMRNVLESVTAEKHKIINEAKRALIKNGACGSAMSGSGPSVFGLFSTYGAAYAAYKKLSCDKFKWDCFLTKTNDIGGIL